MLAESRMLPLLALASLPFAASCDRVPSSTDVPIAINAVDLGAAYTNDESKAQRNYGNNPLLVTGVITGVTADFEDNNVVRMRGPTDLVDVHLTLAKDSRAQARGLKKGSTVTLRCEGATLVIGSPTLDGCALQPPSGRK